MKLSKTEIQALAREIQRKGRSQNIEAVQAVRESPSTVKAATDDYNIFLTLSQAAKDQLDPRLKLEDFIEAHVRAYEDSLISPKTIGKIEDEITLLVHQVKTIQDLEERINPFDK